MINFRFHIVSLTAVFLAFAVGLVLGTSFLDDASERLLERQLDDLDANLNEARAQNTELDGALTSLRDEDEALDQQMGERLFGGKLTSVPVLVIATRGLEAELVQRVLSAVEESDGDVLGVWWLTDRLVLDDADEVADLATALDLATDDVGELREALAGRLADTVLPATAVPGPDQVGVGVDGPAGGVSAEPSLLARLREAGFVDYELPEDSEDDVVELPDSGLRLVVVNGQDAALADTEVLLPFLTDLAADGPVPAVVSAPTPTAVEEGETLPPGAVDLLVGAVRDGDTLGDRVSTVDDLERVAGRIATVLALEDAAPGTEAGHYGLGDGAERVLPAAPEDEDEGENGDDGNGS